MSVALVYDPVLESYEFPPGHPMKPLRFTLAVELMHAWGLVEDGDPSQDAVSRARQVRPTPASDHEILSVHTPELLAVVKAASADPYTVWPGHGLGGDTPAFPGMHEAAALVTGATLQAMRSVLSGESRRAFAPAGGMHHAQADRVAGFCIYNDPAIAIEAATREYPGLRVAYVDIDAHHGDGVQAAFSDRSDVLTLSVHESGRFLFPGTGEIDEIGTGSGLGFALNVPLVPFAGPECYEIVLDDVVVPALRSFGPDVIFLQAGADAHRDDPLTHLQNTVAGFIDTASGIVRLADELCGGAIVAAGGGGYEPYSAVPRQWAGLMALLLGRAVPATLPESWLVRSRALAAHGWAPQAEELTMAEPTPGPTNDEVERAVSATEATVLALRRTHPLLAQA